MLQTKPNHGERRRCPRRRNGCARRLPHLTPTVPLSQTEDFLYRPSWGKQTLGGYDWDKRQVSNITIYMANAHVNALITPA